MAGTEEIHIISPVGFPHEALEFMLKFMGPLDLLACRDVCSDWRKEVDRRFEALKTYDITTVQQLQEILSLFETRTVSMEIQILGLLIERPLDPYPVHDILTLLRLVPWISLGRLEVNGYYSRVQQGQLLNVLQRFQNLVYLEFYKFHLTDSESFQFHCLDGFGRVMDGPSFPTLRHLIIPDYELSLAPVLSSCPNLRSLSVWKLKRPYSNEGIIEPIRLESISLQTLDIPSLNQLRTLNLNLKSFEGTIRSIFYAPERWLRWIQTLIRVLGEFLRRQALTLEKLNLWLSVDVEVRRGQFSIFPLLFPKLKTLQTDLWSHLRSESHS